MRLVRNCDLVRVPWKNGGGTTAEVAVFPAGAGFDAFDWRISMADVGGDGPFSIFPGIERTLVLIDGRGIDLSVDGVLNRLDAQAPLLTFPGEAAATARLVGGPIRDLNVMTRRGRFDHVVEVLGPGTLAPVPRSGDLIALVALEGPTHAVLDGEVRILDRLDVLIADPAPARVVLDRPALLIRLNPSPS